MSKPHREGSSMKANISYPRKNSLAGRYLARFINGEILDHRNADSITGSYRLAAVVHYLESAHHWSIFRYEQSEPTPDPIGRSAVFTRYMLTEEMIRWAGDDGQQWASDVLNLESKRIADREAATSQSAEIKSAPLNTLDKENSTEGD